MQVAVSSVLTVVNMISPEHVVHERTLLGAIDSYLSQLVHTRPQLASDHREALEHFAEVWLHEHSGENDVTAATTDRVFMKSYLARVEHAGPTMLALKSFVDWGRKEGLIIS